jgi:hypothetical protein
MQTTFTGSKMEVKCQPELAVDKVKPVEKSKFDAIVRKILQAKPVSRENVKTAKKKPAAIINPHT